MLLPVNSKVIIFFEHSISISHLMDLKSALNLELIVVVNNKEDYDLCSQVFNTKFVAWDFIDGDLINSIALNDEKQMESLSNSRKNKSNSTHLKGLVEEAKKVIAMNGSSEINKLISSAFINLVEVEDYIDKERQEMQKQIRQLEKDKLILKQSLDSMSNDMDDFVRTYKQVQTQIASRNIVDVMKDNRTIALPGNISSLVIKNYGVPYLMRFVLALKDALTTSYDQYTKVVYIAEPDSVSIQEIKRSQFLLLGEDTKGSDLMKHDLLLCVGNTKEPIDFITSSSAIDVLIIIDGRRTTNELITGQSMTLYTAMDLDSAANLNLDPALTITSSEKSMYTLRESDFRGKKRHALRNNDLVVRVANTLLGS